MVRSLATFALMLGLVGLAGTARASGTGRAMGLYPTTAGSGTAPGLPMLDSKVEVIVRGPLVETVVTQRFANRGEQAIEATYIFPLPLDAAVTAMSIRAGTRTIKASIEKREDAQRRYEAAVTAGVAAAVLDQERPDVFTQTVAAIPAKGTVEIVLRYDALARYADGTWELVLPMVVAPARVVPGASVSIANSSPRARTLAVCARLTRASTRIAWPAPSRGKIPGTTSLAARVPQLTVNGGGVLARSATVPRAIAARSSAGSTTLTVPPVDAASCVRSARAGAGPTPITWIGTPSFLPAASTPASSATRPSLTTTIAEPSGRAAARTRVRSSGAPARVHACSTPFSASTGDRQLIVSLPITATLSAEVNAPNSARTNGWATTVASPRIVAARSRISSMRVAPLRAAATGASTITAA